MKKITTTTIISMIFLLSYGQIDSNSSDIKSQLQGLLTNKAIGGEGEKELHSTTIHLDHSTHKSIDPKQYIWYLDSILTDLESIKATDISKIEEIYVYPKINQFRIDLSFSSDSRIIMVSTKRGIEKRDSILSYRFDFYAEILNSTSMFNEQFTYKGDTINPNELIGYEDEIILKDINKNIEIEIKK
jgi:hypothetical protein